MDDEAPGQKAKSAIGDFLKKKLKKAPQKQGTSERQEMSILLESKFVKSIIENFNSVLELEEQQDKELDQYLGMAMNNPKPEKPRINV